MARLKDIRSGAEAKASLKRARPITTFFGPFIRACSAADFQLCTAADINFIPARCKIEKMPRCNALRKDPKMVAIGKVIWRRHETK